MYVWNASQIVFILIIQIACDFLADNGTITCKTQQKADQTHVLVGKDLLNSRRIKNFRAKSRDF